MNEYTIYFINHNLNKDYQYIMANDILEAIKILCDREEVKAVIRIDNN